MKFTSAMPSEEEEEGKANCEHVFQEDVIAFVGVCKSWNIPYSIERSRSGKGALMAFYLLNNV